jgi:hypothetical protein
VLRAATIFALALISLSGCATLRPSPQSAFPLYYLSNGCPLVDPIHAAVAQNLPNGLSLTDARTFVQSIGGTCATTMALDHGSCNVDLRCTHEIVIEFGILDGAIADVDVKLGQYFY